MLRKDLRCPNCLRIIPNDKFLTEGKCIWCDSEYHSGKCLRDRKLSIRDEKIETK